MPFDKHDAKRRGIDPKLSRIIFRAYCKGISNTNLLSKFVFNKSADLSEVVWVVSIGEFVSFKDLSSILINTKKVDILSELNIVKVSCVEALDKVLNYWDAEVLVMLKGDEDLVIKIVSSVPKLESSWWKFTKGSYEQPYLKQLELCDPIFFYSKTHGSIELIGTTERILKYLGYVSRLLENG